MCILCCWAVHLFCWCLSRLFLAHARRKGCFWNRRLSFAGFTKYDYFELVPTIRAFSKFSSMQLILGICIAFPKMGSALNNYLTPVFAEHFEDKNDPSNYNNVAYPMFIAFFTMCFSLICTIGISIFMQFCLTSTDAHKFKHACWDKPLSLAQIRKFLYLNPLRLQKEIYLN